MWLFIIALLFIVVFIIGLSENPNNINNTKNSSHRNPMIPHRYRKQIRRFVRRH